MAEYELIPAPDAELVLDSEVPDLLTLIRPEWKARNLVDRVVRLLPVDPSSACQRLFNAAVHDLKEKIKHAGLDIARDAAKLHKMPEIKNDESVDRLDVTRTIHLAYYIGILSRPQWRRMCRCYDIRKDLEHEDDEYEAGVEDCVYIFKTCIESVLSVDPVVLLAIEDVKDLVEGSTPVAATADLVEEYEAAPHVRQTEIIKFLVSMALNADNPEIVRQNAYNMVAHFEPLTKNQTKLDIAKEIHRRVRGPGLDLVTARVARAAGVLPYIKKAYRKTVFQALYNRFHSVGYRWDRHSKHGELLRPLGELGGLEHMPEPPLTDFVVWLIQCYVGEKGGYGMGASRAVFYSNSGAPLCRELLLKQPTQVLKVLKDEDTAKRVKLLVGTNKHVKARYDALIQAIEDAA